VIENRCVGRNVNILKELLIGKHIDLHMKFMMYPTTGELY